jgi:rRNA biogenesis protein RRP5
LLRALAERPPETAEDFERLLMASPNSSLVWVRYMAHVLSLGQVENARKIAERALEVSDSRLSLDILFCCRRGVVRG